MEQETAETRAHALFGISFAFEELPPSLYTIGFRTFEVVEDAKFPETLKNRIIVLADFFKEWSCFASPSHLLGQPRLLSDVGGRL